MSVQQHVQLCSTAHLPMTANLDVVEALVPTLSSYSFMMSLPAVKLEGGSGTNGPCT